MTEMGWDPNSEFGFSSPEAGYEEFNSFDPSTSFDTTLENEWAQNDQALQTYDNEINADFSNPSLTETPVDPMSSYTDPSVQQQEIDMLNQESMTSFQDTMNQAEQFDNVLNSGD